MTRAHSTEPEVGPIAATESRHGLAAVFGASLLWGLMPIYLRALRELPSLVIVAYRLVLCCVMVLGWLALRGELGTVRAALREPSTRWRLLATALLISTNWLTYVWAIAHDRVVEASLGYFINPLVNVVLGVLLLGERLRRAQWWAVASATIGVSYLAWRAGSLPLIGLLLAITFGTYGLLRKTIAVDAMTGLAAETLLITPLGAAYVAWAEWQGQGAFVIEGSPELLPLLSLSGLATAVPLWLFAYGARRIPYATTGLMSYIGPSMQFVIAIFVFHEAFDLQRLAGFGFIWLALGIYSADTLLGRV